MSKALRFVPVVLVAVLVAALVWRLANPPRSEVRSAMVGKAAPNVEVHAALPSKAGPASLADGRPKLVNFFASWCVPCIGEAPLLDRLARDGVPIVGIAVRDKPGDLRAFLGRNGDPFESIGADPDSKLQLAFGSSGVPETFVVDGQGIIRMQHIGPIESGDVAALEQAVRNAR